MLVHSRTSAKRAAIVGRKRDYVSPATSGIIATFVDANMTQTVQGYTLAPSAQESAVSPATCQAAASDGSFTCTLFFDLSAAASPYTATLTAYDVAQSGTSATPANGGGTVNALSSDTETISIQANENNAFDFTLHGIVEGFSTPVEYIGADAGPAPSATPLSATFHALDADDYIIDAVDATTSFDYGTQPNGTFTAAPFAVSANDENGCSASPCLAVASPAAVVDPTTETVGVTYSGAGAPGDGTTVAPYYGLIGLTGPAGYNGYVSATLGGTNYAASAYVVPFFGIVDPTNTTTRTDASDVSFTGPSQTANVYALQYHLPTGATGYAIDTSACGSIVSASGPTALASGFGSSFTLTAGTTTGSCSVTLSDGAGDTAVIDVSFAASASNVTVPCSVPTLAPNARNRKATASVPCATHTAALYGPTDGDGRVQCYTPSSTLAGFGFSGRGSVTADDQPDGSVKVHFAYLGGDPNATYNADVTCVGSIGSFHTDANGNATAVFTLSPGYAGTTQSFDAGDSGSDNAITGTFTI